MATIDQVLEATQNLKTEVNARADQARELAEKATAQAEKNGAINAELREQVDKTLAEIGTLKTAMADLEQKASRTAGAGVEVPKSLGEQFAESQAFAHLVNDRKGRGRASLEIKAAVTSVDAPITVPQRVPGIVATPDRRLTIRDLITPGRMDSNAIEYVKETGFDNKAAPVKEGDRKPESNVKLELVSTSARVIAHYIKASRQILDDVSQLASYINGRLTYGLALVEEDQLLNGDGKGQNLFGILPQAKPYVDPIKLKDATKIDTIRLAILQALIADYPASGIVLNPADWASIELQKDSIGRYIVGNPQTQVSATLWGLPVVQTQALPAGKFLTGAFKLGAQVFDRWQSRVEVATENEDDFVRNMVTILAEERLALAVYRPEAFVYGDLPTEPAPKPGPNP